MRNGATWRKRAVIHPIYPRSFQYMHGDGVGRSCRHPPFVADADARNIKVILDFVPNHTSDRHPW